MNTCYFCKGPVKPQSIDHMVKQDGRYILVKHVPAEVCVQCGEVYLDPSASRLIDRAIADASRAVQYLDVPIVACR